MVYKNSILPKDPNEKMKPTLILLPIRLGVDVLNPVYYLALKSIFGFPQTVGIAGGKPSSSLYFVGFEDDNIFYLDPHQAHPSITRADPFTPESFSSYHCQIPKKAPISSLDPCMLIGFYIKDKADFDDFCKRSEEVTII
ncbi:hypothetical protein CONCODRAFT_42017 [Conidiobolus coronatus NRRL 28638]|uniref:Cysteine protease n=1 Tax=Conidiobolus coronatus (strain ATCC 28846 / CBS 209.66 / NRRL 28638) TaxID=796925 RepID=A0A137NZK6_CONC2|nr:hypothetical protein CONCODRAFT_42017 [Conidiobolus coronatus NRRL 28638]|eukprot:KXN68187.1 hypothetical protein CONCODRAFT_42017 [Conidiobolus coronatus NRRL 28638]